MRQTDGAAQREIVGQHVDHAPGHYADHPGDQGYHNRHESSSLR
jgi:hypothetical protein